MPRKEPGRPISATRHVSEEAILAAAERVFAERGFEGATTAAIAAEAGLPKANLHYYFQTKDALYRRVVQRVLEAWLAAADRFDTDSDPAEALAGYVEAKMDLARSRPEGSRIFAAEIMRGAPAIQDFLDTTLRSWVESRAAVVRGWVARGALRPVEPKPLFFMIWAITQHYADFAHQIASLNGGTDLTDDQFAEAKRNVVDLVLASVMRSGRPSAASSRRTDAWEASIST